MREILFQDLISNDNRIRDLLISESVERNGVAMKTERHCLYVIKDRITIDDAKDLEKLAALKLNKDAIPKRHFYISKKHNTKTGENELDCKVEGTIYVVIKKEIFVIEFAHAFKVTVNNSVFTN